MTPSPTVPVTAFPHVFAPLARGRLQLKNRLMMMAVVNNLGTNEHVTPAQIAFYEERAKGGVAAIVTEGLSVHPTSIPNPTVPLAYREELLPGLRRLAEAVHQHDASIYGQLWHVGRNGLWNPSIVPWSPSPERDPFSGSTPHAVTYGEIEQLVEGYVTTARRLQRAGFDGVELHGGHGYLITQFLSPWTNRREDAYGGSLENRARFVREVIEGIRAACRAHFVVGLKLSIDEFVSGGITLEDSQAIVAHLVTSTPPDYFGVTQSNFSPSLELHVPDMRFPPAPFLYLAEGIRAAAGEVPVVFMGRVTGVELAESILARGSADIIGLARALVADAHLARKARSGDAERIRPCIFGNACWEAIHNLRPIACIQAPETGHEAEWGEGTLEPAVTSRTLRVVGAGPAGLEAGRVAALRGHRVHVYDERDRAGGQAADGGIVPDRAEFAKVSEYLIAENIRVGVELHLGQSIDISSVESWLADQDTVLIASGSEPAPPNLPGAADTMTLEAALSRKSWSSLRVVLVDEIEDEPTYAAAEALVKRGATVQIVTRRPSIGRRLAFVSLMGAFRRLDAAGIEIVPLRSPVRMEGTTLITRHGFSGREWAIPGVDAVVFAGPYRARDDLARELHRRGHDVRLIGDAYAPRRALVAVLDGHAAGRQV